MEAVTRLNKGNWNSRATKVETAGSLGMPKAFRGKTPVNSYRLTETGRGSLRQYWERMGTAGGGRSRA